MKSNRELIESTRCFIRVHRVNRVADRTPLPDFLFGLLPESLVNLEWTDPALAVGDYAWLPPVEQPAPPFDPETHTTTDDTETLVADLDAGVVLVTPGVRPLTPDELAERAESLKAVKSRLVESIDNLISGIYARWLRFEAEYVEREAAARAYVAAGYAGDPGLWVMAFATSAGKTNEDAANLIIAQADALRAVLKSLGALRMSKYSILAASTAEAAHAKHDEIAAQAKDIAAALEQK